MKLFPTLLLALAIVITSCSSMNRMTKGTIIGSTAGAAVGATAGAYFGDTAKGAIIGAVVGGATGAIIGRHMDKQAEELAREVEGATVARFGEGIAISFESGLLFGFDSADLQSAARDNLTKLSSSLKNYPDSDVLILGHTDSSGSDSYNQTLSERRANAAKDYLVSLGISANRIKSEGKGEAEPIGSNDTDAGRESNRRIEVAIFASDEYVARIQAQNN